MKRILECKGLKGKREGEEKKREGRKESERNNERIFIASPITEFASKSLREVNKLLET